MAETHVTEGNNAVGMKAKAAQPVSVQSSEVFSLADYADNYTGRHKIQRLMFIGRSCPELSVDAFRLAAITTMQETMDTELYQSAYSKYTEARKQSPTHPETSDVLEPNSDWIATTNLAAQKEKDKLQVELKSYQSNLIKESIRMAYRDLGNFYRKTGDLQAALRCHTKSREYCSLPSHVIDMCLAVIELALEMGNYAFVRNYLIKAEAAIESAGTGSLSSSSGPSTSGSGKQSRAVNLPGMVAPQATRAEQAQEREKQMLLDKLALASGIADLGQAHYARAARSFTRLSSTSIRSLTEAGHLDVSAGDIAMYTVLCGLATFDRADIKSNLLENSNLRSLLETEPHLRQILNTFYDSQYATTLKLLERHAPRHLLDVHLSNHVPFLVSSILDKAVVSFTKPFTSVSLAKMASSFGWSEQQSKDHALRLIQNGSLEARIDTKHGALKTNQLDVRRDLFSRALEVGQELEDASKKVQLRVQLLQNDLIVKDPLRSRNQPQGRAVDPGSSSIEVES